MLHPGTGAVSLSSFFLFLIYPPILYSPPSKIVSIYIMCLALPVTKSSKAQIGSRH